MSKKNSIEDLQKIFNEDFAELDLTSEYKDRRAPTLKYTCKYGKVHITSLAHWQKGTRCLCEKQYNTRSINYKKAEELLTMYGASLVTLFEDYTTVTTPIEFKNCVGELQKISLNNLKVFKLTDTISYKPDFYLPRLDTYLEVKGRMMELDLNKVKHFRSLGFKLILLNRDTLEKANLINSSGKIIYDKPVPSLENLLVNIS